MKLSIQNYNLLNFNDNYVIISEKGVSRVNSTPLVEVVRALNNRNTITDDELFALFDEYSLNPDEAYTSLQASLGLAPVSKNEFFSSVILAHDWVNSEQFELLISGELTCPKTICAIPELHKLANHNRPYIVIIYSKYNYDELKQLYFQITLKFPGSAVSVCYPSDENYVIGQPYFPTIGNPCHFCSIDKVSDHEAYKSSTNTWSTLLLFCRNRHIPVPAPNASLYQKCLIVGAIVEKINTMTGAKGAQHFQDNILQETRLSLNNGYVSEASVSHWSMCECLRLIA